MNNVTMEAAIKSFDALYMTLLVNLSNIEVYNTFSQLGTRHIC